jgi:hypothetical protein
MHASISHYDASDGVGSLELENLRSLHFERSACQGFDPLHVAVVGDRGTQAACVQQGVSR